MSEVDFGTVVRHLAVLFAQVANLEEEAVTYVEGHLFWFQIGGVAVSLVLLVASVIFVRKAYSIIRERWYR